MKAMLLTASINASPKLSNLFVLPIVASIFNPETSDQDRLEPCIFQYA